MAAIWNRVQDLSEEATCPICLDYFRDPAIITECGHNFCRGCLSQAEGGRETSCPQCRRTFQEGSLLPNRQLANFVEITKKLSLQRPKVEERQEGVCEKHQEPLKLFCKEDAAPICVVCDRSREHRNHEVVPAEEAAQEYKDVISHHLEHLKEGQEKILAHKEDTGKESQNLLKQIKMEKQKTVAEFRQLHQFLKEQEELLLGRMEEAEKEIGRIMEENLAKLSGELSSLKSLTEEMEKKYQQPPSELLQGVRSILQRSENRETTEDPVVFLPEFKWKIWDLCDIRPFLAGIMKQFTDAVLSGLQLQKGNITLDPDTAHPQLTLSEDHRSVTWEDKVQYPPVNEKRFTTASCVLGREGFTAGRYFWEVTVGEEELCSIGITRESIKRKGDIDYCPEGGIWALKKWGHMYWAMSPLYDPPCLIMNLKKIRVSLNCRGGQVGFYDADTADHLYTFSEASFRGETLVPFFELLSKGPLSISP